MCFAEISRLQSVARTSNAVAWTVLIVSGLVLLVNLEDPPLLALALGILILLPWFLVLAMVGRRRRALLAADHFQETRRHLETVHRQQTGSSHVEVVPLATAPRTESAISPS